MYYEKLLRKQIENERKKKRLVVYTCFLLICVYLLFNLLFDDMGILQYVSLKKTEKKLVQEIASLQQENTSIEKEIQLMQDNPFYIEKHARENFNLAHPDEYIFLYER